MKRNAKMMVMGLVLAMVFCYAGPSLAETSVGTTTAAVDLIFQVTIANYIEFQVGTAGAATDTVNFSPNPDQLLNSTSIKGTGGNLGGSQVTVRLLSNTPQITITATNNTPNGLANGSNYINWESITTTDLGGIGGNLAPPLLTNAGNTTSADSPMVGAQNITRTWEYEYTRRGIDPIPTVQGSYSGTVTYTATSP